MNCKVVIFLVIVFLAQGVKEIHAQKILALNKPGKEKRIRFFVKDPIHVKLKGENYALHGNITAIGDSSIDIDDFRVPIAMIKVVLDYDKRRLVGTFSKVFLMAGAAFMAVDVINRTSQDLRPILNQTSVAAAGILIGAGAVASVLRIKRYRMNHRHWLQIIDLGNDKE